MALAIIRPTTMQMLTRLSTSRLTERDWMKYIYRTLNSSAKYSLHTAHLSSRLCISNGSSLLVEENCSNRVDCAGDLARLGLSQRIVRLHDQDNISSRQM